MAKQHIRDSKAPQSGGPISLCNTHVRGSIAEERLYAAADRTDAATSLQEVNTYKTKKLPWDYHLKAADIIWGLSQQQQQRLLNKSGDLGSLGGFGKLGDYGN